MGLGLWFGCTIAYHLQSCACWLRGWFRVPEKGVVLVGSDGNNRASLILGPHFNSAEAALETLATG